MARYSYTAVSATTGQRLAEFPLLFSSWTRLKSSAGSWEATLPLTKATAALDPITNSEPYTVEIIVERVGSDGKKRIVYDGLVVNDEYDSTTQGLKISGFESWAYLDKRFVEWDVTYTAIDQGLIVQDLLTRAAGSPNGDFRIDLPSAASMTTGINRTIAYLQADCKPLSEAIEELAAVQGGFEFYLEPYWSGNVLRHRLVWGYPLIGSRGGGTTRWDLPGSIDRYRWRRQGGPMFNEGFGVGDDGTGHVLLKRVKNLPGRQPLLQGQVPYRAISDVPLLTNWTQQQVNKAMVPVVAAFVRVHGSKTPEHGTYALGDDALFRFNDQRFKNVAQLFRLKGWTLTPPGRGQQELVDLVVEAV